MKFKSELMSSYLAIFLGTGTGLLMCAALQKHLNAQVIKKCDTSIYVVKYAQSAVGDMARCVSKAQLHGPTLPLQD
jgi:hypothetical protein